MILSRRLDDVLKAHDWSGKLFSTISRYSKKLFGKQLFSFPTCDVLVEGWTPFDLRKISAIQPQGIVLTEPGEYTVTNDVTWDQELPNTAAIRIAGSDITLNLNNKRINCTKHRSNTACAAVCVTGDGPDVLLKNVTVKNGVIDHFATFGVLAVGVDNISVVDVMVQNIHNSNVSSPSSGILIAACNFVTVRGCKALNSSVTSLVHFGIQLRGCSHFQVTACTMERQQNATGTTTGLSIVACREGTASKCDIRHIVSGGRHAPESQGNTALGVFVFLSIRTAVQEMSIRNVHGSCDDAHGVSVFVCPENVSVSDCKVADVTSGFRTRTGTSAKVTGYEIMVARDIRVVNCTATYIRAKRPQHGQCAGFSSGLSTNVEFRMCAAKDVACVGRGRGVGFGWAPEARAISVGPSINAVMWDCSASSCEVGFDLFMYQGATLVNCVATSNVKKPVDDNPDEVRTYRCDVCSECPKSQVLNVKNKAKNNVLI